MQQNTVSRAIAPNGCRDGDDCIDSGCFLQVVVSSLNILNSSVTTLPISLCREPVALCLVLAFQI
jgi:hypothetical protein